MGFFLPLYNGILATGMAAGAPWIIPYLLLTPKRRRNLARKLGVGLPAAQSKVCAGGRPIWVHTLSVGEAISALPLVDAIVKRYPSRQIYVSISTETGLDVARKTMNGMPVTLFTSPFDFPPLGVRRVFTSLNPAAVIIVESDLWPNLLAQAEKRRTPVLLANARMSDRSFSRYHRVRPLAKTLFGYVSAIGSQSDVDRERYTALGLDPARIVVTGNIKFDQPVKPMDTAERAVLRSRLGIDAKDTVLVAGSTHPGEEEWVGDAARQLIAEGLLDTVVVVPRDPDRADAVRRIFAEKGLPAQRLTAIESDSDAKGLVKVIVVDRIGLLKELYAIADLAFVGGSLIEAPHLGGHNPLEPAAYGKPVIVGPNMKNFRAIALQLAVAGGLIQIQAPQALYDAACALLAHPDKAEEAGRAGFKVFRGNAGAVNRTVEILNRWIPTG